MRRARFALVAILAMAGFSALAATPEDVYWTARTQAMAQLKALADKKASPDKINEVERAALKDLQRRLIAMVGTVSVQGYSDGPKSHLTALSDSPDFGQLDGVSFYRRDGIGGELVVTTEALLRLWLQEASSGHPGWRRAGFAALKSDAFYGEALNAEDGYLGIADLELRPPPGATFAAAKLGRWGLHTDTIPSPVLIVTVSAGGRVFIAVSQPETRIDDIPACRTPAADADPSMTDAFGPLGGGPELEAWRNCERRNLPTAPSYADLMRETRQIADRLAHAN